MSFTLMIVLGYLLNFLFLAAQWVGVLGLSKTEKRHEWWCMAAGTCLTTIGRVGMVQTWLIPNPLFQQMIIGGCTYLGMLLFAAGFAIHGYRHSRIDKRITELETINLAHATELERLRNR